MSARTHFSGRSCYFAVINCNSDDEAELLTNHGVWCDVLLAAHTVLCSCQKQLLTLQDLGDTVGDWKSLKQVSLYWCLISNHGLKCDTFKSTICPLSGVGVDPAHTSHGYVRCLLPATSGHLLRQLCSPVLERLTTDHVTLYPVLHLSFAVKPFCPHVLRNNGSLAGKAH